MGRGRDPLTEHVCVLGEEVGVATDEPGHADGLHPLGRPQGLGLLGRRQAAQVSREREGQQAVGQETWGRSKAFASISTFGECSLIAKDVALPVATTRFHHKVDPYRQSCQLF